MKILRRYPVKYRHSTLDGKKILCIDYYYDKNDGYSINIITRSKSKSYFINGKDVGFIDEVHEYSADAILCHLQQENGISVDKYYYSKNYY